MKKYNGYYIDGVIFHNKQEIDTFIKNTIIDKIRLFYGMLTNDRYTAAEKIAISDEITKREIRLHDEFNMEWNEIEEILFIA